MMGKSFHDKKKGIGIIYDDIYLVNGARTPFGKYCGTLGKISPTDLGIYASRSALINSELSALDIDQVIVANIGQSSCDAYFLPRHISLYTGIPKEIPSLMVQRICGSGFETIITGADQISLGKAETVLCCGTENMSLSPAVNFGSRMGHSLGDTGFRDMLWESLDDTAAGYPMGFTAENIAGRYKISRSETDQFAKLSFDRALASKERGFFKGEIIPLNPAVFEAEGVKARKVLLPKGTRDFDQDEHIRPTTTEGLAKLLPVFSESGVLTAGNSSGMVDGSAAVTVTNADTIKAKSLKPLTKILAAASCGVDPREMGLGPVPAIRLILEMTGLNLSEIGLFEINEAFSAQYIGCERELNLDRNICNVNGGAIAIGHPLAATGTRLSLTISREMQNRKVKYGIASACIGGGQGTAILFENVNL